MKEFLAIDFALSTTLYFSGIDIYVCLLVFFGTIILAELTKKVLS